MSKSKNELRHRIRVQRRGLSPERQMLAADKVYQHITHLNRYRLSKHLAFYLSYEGELNPESLLLHAHQMGKHCYLPISHPRQIGTLSFFRYIPNDPLKVNRFGILEPVVDPTQNPFPAWQLDIVFTPLVAFDQQRNRLGMGLGYYDRTFAFLNHSKADKPYLIGLAYQMQQVDQLIIEAHDVRLNMIVTEDNIH